MELSTRYTPAEFESAIYTEWTASGGFQPRSDHGTKGVKTFTIMIPPPNVTGVLHMGHALNNTIQDIVIRHRRMCGWNALWVPGTDHAGIATQAVVERKLFEEEKKTRKDLGRDAFLERVWAWKEKHGNYILEQFRRMGFSCDWSRTRFTMEPAMSRAVREAFVRLFEKGLVYRGPRLVNWDCVLETAVGDDEIEYVQRKDKLYHIRYPLKGRTDEHVTVATTRPETMLADTGVAVNGSDERYKELVGKTLILPIVGREIPIVADESVESEFGTGAVKVTPGHDPADYERGARHKLPIVNLYEKDGKLNDNGGPYKGMSREKARTEVVKKLEELGLLAKVEDYTHNVAISERSKSVIEPLVSEQWFVKMKPLAEPAIEAVKNGALTLRPERWTKVYLDWLLNVRDWCISRQLWWGHQIPVWYDADGVPVASREDLEIGSPHPKTKKPIVRRDEDVLDTWASSWLWPFATLGWPDKTEDLAHFYPTQFLSTAREIIYLWVARMVMAGYEFMDHVPAKQRCPFAVCYVNATVLDAKGRRMSKQAGNGIDPIEMIDKYGADAVRYSLVLLTREGQDVKLSPDRFEQGFRFSNKVWNAARFVLMNLDESRLSLGVRRIAYLEEVPPSEADNLVERAKGVDDRLQGLANDSRYARKQLLSQLEDRWILSRLGRVTGEVSEALDEYRFNDAASSIYRFVWNDFCDWYLEIVKPRVVAKNDQSAIVASEILVRVLSDALHILHPFTPFMTEVLWKAVNERLGKRAPDSMLMNSRWPSSHGLTVDTDLESEMQVLQEVVQAVRRIRNLTMIGERDPVAALYKTFLPDVVQLLDENVAMVSALAHLQSLERITADEHPKGYAVAVAGTIEVFVRLEEHAELGKLRDVLSKRAEKVRAGIASVDSKLANANFIERADPDVVAEERERRSEMALELELLERNVAGFNPGVVERARLSLDRVSSPPLTGSIARMRPMAPRELKIRRPGLLAVVLWVTPFAYVLLILQACADGTRAIGGLMFSTRHKQWMITCGLAVGMCLFAQAQTGGSARTVAPEATQEPPLEFLLEHEGETMSVRLDESVQLTTSRGPVSVTLRMKPTRRLHLRGVSFEYPVSFAWSVDTSKKTSTTWTLDGNDVVVHLTRVSGNVNSDQLLEAIVARFKSQYGELLTKAERSSVKLGQVNLNGYRVFAHIAAAQIVQDVFVFVADGVSHALVVQDALSDTGAESEEHSAFMKLLDRTLEVRPEAVK